jgi:dihydrolipoamide dehydrogenase
LNVGCIPTKALLHSTEHFAWAKEHAAAGGIHFDNLRCDLAALMARKDGVVSKLTGGIAQLAKGRKVEVFTGTATFVGPKTVRVTNPSGQPAAAQSGDVEISAANIVVATGSAPVELPALPFDGKTVVSSDEAIAFDGVPERLVVVGGGAIGLELGSVWARLGSQVTVVEFLPKIAATFDDDMVRPFARLLQKQGLRLETSAKVVGIRKQEAKGEAPCVLLAERDGKQLEFSADKVLVAVGRRPYTEGLNLAAAGVELDERRRIKVDERLRTSAAGIWAIGDVVAGPMLAHKAEEDGVAVAEWIAGKAGHIDWDLMPAIVYTDPELASVGLGEDAAKTKGVAVRVGKFNFAANGRALAAEAADGLVKIVADATTDRILGAQILGRGAGELIGEVVAHMSYGGSAEDLARTIHAHPTMSEAVKEAALAVSKSAIHGL